MSTLIRSLHPLLELSKPARNNETLPSFDIALYSSRPVYKSPFEQFAVEFERIGDPEAKNKKLLRDEAKFNPILFNA